MPNFEVFDARIASVLNRIIHNSHFKRRVSLEEQKAPKQDRFLYLIYEHFRVTRAHDPVENCSVQCTIVLRNEDIQKFDSTWDGILLSMTKIPPDDILEGLHKLTSLRNSRPYWNCLTWRSIRRKQDLIITDWNFGEKKYRARCTNEEFWRQKRKYERNTVVKNQGTKQRGQRILGDCWQWKSSGQCSKGDNCSNKRAKMTQPNSSPNSFMQQNERNASRTRCPRGKSPSGRMSRWPCKDFLHTNSFCKKWLLQNACSTRPRAVANVGKSAHMHIVDEQPSKKSKRTMSHVEEEWSTSQRTTSQEGTQGTARAPTPQCHTHRSDSQVNINHGMKIDDVQLTDCVTDEFNFLQKWEKEKWKKKWSTKKTWKNWASHAKPFTISKVTVVVTFFVEILDDFHDFVSAFFSFPMKINNQFWGHRFPKKSGNFHWAWNKNTHFTDENQRKKSLRSVPSSIIILLE